MSKSEVVLPEKRHYWPGVAWGVVGNTLWYKVEDQRLWPGGKGFPTKHMKAVATRLKLGDL